MKTIIFVCHGSICRSPAAAFIARQYLKELGRDNEFDIQIRATSSEEIGNDIYPPMKRELLNNNIKIDRHSAQRIDMYDYNDADYIFYMDEENHHSLARMFGDSNKIKPIYEWTPSINEIEDPWYTGRYHLVLSQIIQCIKDILNNIE